MLTKEQLEERLNYITATDAPIICGLSKYKSPIRLFQEKTRMIEAEDKSDLPWIRAGHYLEEPIAQWFADDTCKVLVKDESLKVHADIPFIAAHIDRLVKGERAAVECKTSRYGHNWGEQGENNIPDEYLVQCVVEAAAWDLERVYVAALIGGSDFRHYVYERSQKLEDAVIKRLKKFWEHVRVGVCPDPATGSEVIELYGNMSDDEVKVSDIHIEEAVEELRIIKDAIKEHEKKAQALEDKIKVFMGTSAQLVYADGEKACTWKTTKDVSRFDSKAFKEDYPDLHAKYIKVTEGHRRFLLAKRQDND